MPIQCIICNSYKKEILQGIHSSKDQYKIALFGSSADLDTETTSYRNQPYEVEGKGYKTGGLQLDGFQVGNDGGISWLTFNNPLWKNITITARKALIYNDSHSEKPTLAVLDFKYNIITRDTDFTLQFPVANTKTALIRIG